LNVRHIGYVDGAYSGLHITGGNDMSSELQFVRALIVIVRARAARARSEGRNELGASALEWAIISAIIAALAVAVAAKIKSVVDDKTAEISGD